jgi:NAD(P)-dependent dehydrogenase (short-subunit alcohol dehydrogenase family)
MLTQLRSSCEIRTIPFLKGACMAANTVVLITGAASGIGASAARRFHRRGASVVLVDVNESGLVSLTDDLGDTRSLAVAADVTDFDAVVAAVAAGVKRFGGIDAVVANAGVGSWVSMLEMGPEEFRRVIDVNLTGVFHTVSACLPILIERRGYVLVVASLASYVAAPGLAPYCASKAGVEHFTNVVRLELAPHGVDVGSAHMTWVDTPLLRSAQSESAGFAGMLAALPGPLKRTLSADDCAAGIVTAVDKRLRHAHMPGWVALARWVKPILSTRPMERHLRRQTAGVLASRS